MADFFAFGSGGLQEIAKQLFAKLKPLLDGKYTNPSGGIPKTDLTHEVLTSLGKADTALQAVPDTYRTAADQDVIDAVRDDDIHDLKSAVKKKAPAIYDTASGAIASFEDGADGMPLKSLMVNIEPAQSGTGDPSPENVRPITGWTGCKLFCGGKNLIPSGITVGKGYINASGDIAGSEVVDGYRHTADYIRVYPNTAYTISGDVFGKTTGQFYNTIAYYDANKNFLSRFVPASANTPAQFTTPSNCAYIRFNFPAAGNIVDIQMEYGNAATSFDSQASVYSITFPSEAGTVYGGTLNLVNGMLKAFPYYASYNGETLVGPWVSSMDVYAPGTNPTIGAQVVDLGGAVTEYDLSDIPEITTLLGTNNIWADCGSVSVDYPADTKLYIQKVNAPTDNDMIADTQIDSGKYFLINNSLYLSTTTIPAGDPIKPGTNCQKTNLAAALNALNT